MQGLLMESPRKEIFPFNLERIQNLLKGSMAKYSLHREARRHSTKSLIHPCSRCGYLMRAFPFFLSAARSPEPLLSQGL